MKKRIYILLALLILNSQVFSKNAKSNDKKNKKNTEVEINFNNETLTSANGIDIYYGVNKFEVSNIKRDEKNKKIYANGKFTFNSYQPTGKVQLTGKNAIISIDEANGNFEDSRGYIDVSKITGAEKPNEKIYFGGDKVNLNNGIIIVKNSWFTTDSKITKKEKLTGLGYYINSEHLKIEPDKQITLENLNLFIHDYKVLPFSFPWYRFNIREGSKLPLFPVFGNEKDYGWSISQGILYESKDKKFRGGIAPKFGDKIGFLIGRMENWYKIKEYGESRLNINDLLIFKKEKNTITPKTKRQNSNTFDRWDVDYSHKYSGNYGKFNLGIKSITYNLNKKLNGIIKDYDRKGKFDYINDNGQLVKGELGKIPNMGNHSNFYTLDTKLTSLFPKKDTTITAKINLTDDKKAFEYIAVDKIDKMGYGAQVDNDLYSNISIVKDNSDYKLTGYYDYLYDADPGSNLKDTQSRAENFGFSFNDKNNKINLNYDEKNEDKFRKLNSWERNPDLSSLIKTGNYGLKAEYIPWTVSQYDTYNNRNFNLSFGKYKLTKSNKIKAGYDYKFVENKLNLKNDPMREKVLENSRWSQYNRFENIISNKTKEDRAYTTFYTNIADITFAGGKFKEEIKSREGINSVFQYKTYQNESDFVEIGLTKDKINLGVLGNFNIFANIRKDKYSNKNIKKNNTSLRYQGGLTHKVNIFDNTNNENRYIDMNLNNEFTFFYQGYTYNGNRANQEQIFINKENIYDYKNKISFDLGNTKTIYTGKYKIKEKPITNIKLGKIFDNKIDFLINDDKAISAYYKNDKKFNKQYNGGNNYYNDLEYEDFGANIYLRNHQFYYKNHGINFKDKDFKNKILQEKIKENIFGYIYKFDENSLNFEYKEGQDKAKLENNNILNIDNKTYKVSYVDGGEIENNYGVTYETFQQNYKKNMLGEFKTVSNSNIISLNYGFKDKRLEEEKLLEYAKLEYGDEDLITRDFYKIKTILENKRANGFDFKSIKQREHDFGEYRRSFNVRLTLESKNDRRKTKGYWNSLSKIETSLFYSQYRTGFGYRFTQRSKETSKENWKVNKREHEFSFHSKVGKPSEGWRIKTFIKFNDNIDTKYGDGTGRKYFDEIGVELGKEMDYYEWAVAYKREYNISTRDYEWRTGIQFTLLTFPDKTLFGIGAKGGSQENQKTKPQVKLLNGIKIKN